MIHRDAWNTGSFLKLSFNRVVSIPCNSFRLVPFGEMEELEDLDDFSRERMAVGANNADIDRYRVGWILVILMLLIRIRIRGWKRLFGDIFEWENDPTSERSHGNVSVANYSGTREEGKITLDGGDKISLRGIK